MLLWHNIMSHTTLCTFAVCAAYSTVRCVAHWPVNPPNEHIAADYLSINVVFSSLVPLLQSVFIVRNYHWDIDLSFSVFFLCLLSLSLHNIYVTINTFTCILFCTFMLVLRLQIMLKFSYNVVSISWAETVVEHGHGTV